jgi:hypothetical protein
MAIRFSQHIVKAIFNQLCDDYNVAKAMRLVGGSASGFWGWMGESYNQKNECETPGSRTESKFFVAGLNPERPEEKMWFHEAMGVRAKKIWALNTDANIRASMAPTPLRDQRGDVVYEKCPKLLAEFGGEHPDAYAAAAAIGVVDYPYLHKIVDGIRERIPVLIDQMPATKFQHVTRSTMGHLGYNPSEEKVITNTHKIEGIVVHKRQAPTPMPRQRAPHELDAMLEQIRKNGPQHPRPQGMPNLGLPRPAAGDRPDVVTTENRHEIPTQSERTKSPEGWRTAPQGQGAVMRWPLTPIPASVVLQRTPTRPMAGLVRAYSRDVLHTRRRRSRSDFTPSRIKTDRAVSEAEKKFSHTAPKNFEASLSATEKSLQTIQPTQSAKPWFAKIFTKLNFWRQQ